MNSPATDQATADAYRVIGRYVVEFSQLMFLMRSELARYLGSPRNRAEIAHLVLGQAMPNQLTDAFFAVCIEAGNLDADETKVARSLRALG